MIITNNTFSLDTFVSAYTARRYGMFLHFNSQTWSGNGVTGPMCSPIYDAAANFDPASIDVDQWISTMIAAKMKYAVLVVVQAPGFCLWNTDTTDYNSFNTDWYQSEAGIDIVTEFVTKCRTNDILPCFYVSTCQRRFEYENPGFTQAMYLAHLKAQLKELLSRFGQIGGLWIDNNNWQTTGTTGWPEGWTSLNPMGSNIYYPFDDAAGLKDYVHSIQRQCVVMYNDHQYTFVSSDIKGIEKGALENDDPLIAAGGMEGYEATVTIYTDGTKYFADDDYELASAANLISTINSTVTRGGSYLLNAPPGQSGLISSAIVTRLTEVAAGLDF